MLKQTGKPLQRTATPSGCPPKAKVVRSNRIGSAKLLSGLDGFSLAPRPDQGFTPHDSRFMLFSRSGMLMEAKRV